MHPGIIASRTPEKPAFVMANDGAVVTYRELNARSNQVAHLLRSLGFRRGDCVALFMENNRHYFEICWGAHRAGLYYTCISSYLTAAEVAYILQDCGAGALFTSAAKAAVAAELPGLIGDLPHKFMVGGEDQSSGFADYAGAVAPFPETAIADEAEGSDMLYSSGTTGRPKGIKIPLKEEPFGTPPTLIGLLQNLYGMDHETLYLSPAPLYHAAPLRFNLGIQRLGGTSVIMERFDAEAALKLIEHYRITHSQWVPTMFVRMLKLPAEMRAQYDVSSMQVAIHAAAPCPLDVKDAMMDWWGPVIYEYYGGTEGNGFVAANPTEWLAHRGTVGRALMGEIRILDDDHRPLPTGQSGTVYFADGNAFEYHNDPEKTAQSRSQQGWTTLGDVGYVDEDGFLYLTDRKAYVIISGGVNIYPQEVEDLLVGHPQVLDAAVFGVPDPEFGEQVKAVVQLVDPATAGPETAETLIAYCRGRLSAIKCPRTVDFEAELPRHANGKLYKRLLKDRYWGKGATTIV